MLQAFRAKRGGGIYENVGVASTTEVDELRTLATKLRRRVRTWLGKAHPDLAPSRR